MNALLFAVKLLDSKEVQRRQTLRGLRSTVNADLSFGDSLSQMCSGPETLYQNFV